ncbi:uncharacterized protein B0T23DRAFT_137025 [Neurospora hispaniola]|uniref:Transmembrane protein n=1 Tax=Neurospora hispaniola TaxID=588809 RepID=A0AAJ0I7J3_9PEZI|nr:hypothetical protein B0T23DRAFT_137025 [Neurospora hispaniola]
MFPFILPNKDKNTIPLAHRMLSRKRFSNCFALLFLLLFSFTSHYFSLLSTLFYVSSLFHPFPFRPSSCCLLYVTSLLVGWFRKIEKRRQWWLSPYGGWRRFPLFFIWNGLVVFGDDR